jgi:hypothetical protein
MKMDTDKRVNVKGWRVITDPSRLASYAAIGSCAAHLKCFIIDTYLGVSDLLTLLEVLGEGLNELVSRNALDGNTLIGVDNAELNL